MYCSSRGRPELDFTSKDGALYMNGKRKVSTKKNICLSELFHKDSAIQEVLKITQFDFFDLHYLGSLCYLGRNHTNILCNNVTKILTHARVSNTRTAQCHNLYPV